MPAWPSNVLPAPSASFAGNVQPSVVSTTMDSGRVRQRARFTRVNRVFNVAWQLSEAQYGVFQSFIKWKLTNGADAFTIDLPIGAGGGIQNVSAIIVNGEYAAGYDSVMYWNVSCKLIVPVITLMTEAALDAAILAGDVDYIPRTQAFTVNLAQDDISKVVNFPVSFGVLGAPTGLYVSLVSPGGGFSFDISERALSRTAVGFIVDLGAAVPSAGYQLSIIASFDL